MRRLLPAIALVVIGLLAIFVWPTQWQYHEVGRLLVKTNRFTGVTFLFSVDGWTRVPEGQGERVSDTSGNKPIADPLGFMDVFNAPDEASTRPPRLVTRDSSDSEQQPDVLPEIATLIQALGRSKPSQSRDPVSNSDWNAVAAFTDLPGRWNRESAVLVRDYLDPNVSAQKWVNSSTGRIAELRAIQIEMQSLVLAIGSSGVRRTFEEFADNYRAKVECLTALHNAVARGDRQAELDARYTLSEVSEEGRRLGVSFLDRLRPYIDPDLFVERMKKGGKSIGDLMRP